jgi:hypothetical protein
MSHSIHPHLEPHWGEDESTLEGIEKARKQRLEEFKRWCLDIWARGLCRDGGHCGEESINTGIVTSSTKVIC